MGELDYEDLGEVLDKLIDKQPKRPILMQVNLGATETGAMDNLPIIHQLLVEKVQTKAFSVHVNAALMVTFFGCLHQCRLTAQTKTC